MESEEELPSVGPSLGDDSSQQSVADVETTAAVVTARDGCYCDGERDPRQVELQCCRCAKWFHRKCVSAAVGPCLPFLTNYVFWCRDCAPRDPLSGGVAEVFQRRQTSFASMCETAIANLMAADSQRVAFSKDKDIIPFIDSHWEELSTQARRVKNSWHQTVAKTLAKDSDVFIQDARDPTDPLFALRNRDLLKIGPNYETTFGGRAVAGVGGRGAKRRLDIKDEALGAKRQKSELSSPRLPASGFPTEFPYNKDGYRYVLAEPDPHGPHRQEFEESVELAGKPIPGWLCRKLTPDWVALSLHDRAMQLKVSEDRRVVTGEKGYCMVRANFGVSRGLWFFESRVEELPDGAAVRLGWAQELANIQAPLGYDKFGYSFRSRKGTAFHESRGRHFADTGFTVGDVIGVGIELPDDGVVCRLPQTYKDKPLVRFKSYLYFEEKDDIPRALQALRPLNRSRIVFYRNGQEVGVAFSDVYAGTYYPAISLYKSASVSLNFGPKFEFAPPAEFRPMADLVVEQQTEQTLSDLLYLVCNEEKLRLDIFYGQN